MEIPSEDQQKQLWGRVARISSECTYWGESSPQTENFAEAAMEEFVIIPRPGIKHLLVGDVLYSGNESVTIAAVWDQFVSTEKEFAKIMKGEGVRFQDDFRDGDFGSDGREYYLTAQQ